VTVAEEESALPDYDVIELDDLGSKVGGYSSLGMSLDARDDLPTEDDLVELSKRFAPQRRAE
jgi:hypothetical protein